MVVLSLSNLLHNEVNDYWTEKVKERDGRQDLRQQWEEIDKPREAKAELQGDQVLKDMRELLARGFGIKRSETQWKVHNGMVEAMLPKIFGQEFETHSGRILASMGMNKLQQEVMVVMARRQGKSYSVGMGCAAMLLLCSDVRLAVFATGKRMAAALLDITKRMIEKAWERGAVPRKGYEIVHANQEVFHLKGPDGTDRILNVMPGTAKVSNTPPPQVIRERHNWGFSSVCVSQVSLVFFLPLVGEVPRKTPRFDSWPGRQLDWKCAETHSWPQKRKSLAVPFETSPQTAQGSAGTIFPRSVRTNLPAISWEMTS
jgi:hypothetical protein